MSNYYKKELDRLKHSDRFRKTIKLTDEVGTATRIMSLNLECISALQAWLEEERQRVIDAYETPDI